MKKILKLLFSFQLMAVLFIVFFLSIAIATFLENDFGTLAAKALVYNAFWFEVLMFIGIVNMVGIIFKHKLYRKEKLSVFTFHLSLVVILIGAAITRYLSWEGVMHIREGESTSHIISEKVYLGVFASDGQHTAFTDKDVMLASRGGSRFSKSIKLATKDTHKKTRLHTQRHKKKLWKTATGLRWLNW
ncbi:MAG: cytochrome c biogenesis protein ResB [Bacteroidales bacterium]|nr:cytochrome c biogenesis protein ResB [Bacteroidales bacterium]